MGFDEHVDDEHYFPLNSMPGTPMSKAEMERQCQLVSGCPEISEDDEWEL